MQWYVGGIAEAVSLSRINNSIFVVYIEGDDEVSKQMTEIINDEKVSVQLSSSNFVAIKIEAGSVTHTQFSEIYKQAAVPSLYFIGKSGTPLEILTKPTNSEDVLLKINNVIVKDGGVALKLNSEALINSESVELESGDVDAGKDCEEPTTSKDDESNNSLSTEEKLKVALDLIEKKREVKKQEEEENERRKEIERRKLGQDVQKMKRWQQDQELKQMMEERQRERREEQEARDKVRRQIEEDKREKAARMNAHQTSPQPPDLSRPARTTNSTISRLQFRLPDGATHTHDFDKAALLQEVIDYIKNNLNLSFNNFVLSTTFPRREFTAEDAELKLMDLELVPTAVILVLPIQHGAVATNNGTGIMGMVWYLLSPILSIFGYIKGLLFPNSNKRNERPGNKEDGTSTSRPIPKKRSGEAVIRRQGNIHRLTDPDSDDDNNTWNGNSTQQM